MITFCGGYLLVKLRFFYILHPIRTLKFTFKGQNTRKSVISLMLALAGTLGVGNIVGVAYGIYRGGAGSVFWLAVSALFSSAIKYAEVNLSARHATGYGILSVIEGNGRPSAASKTYAVLALVLSFAMGSLLQAQAVSESAFTLGKVSPLVISAVFFFTAIVCTMGKDRIKASVAVVIPAATILYTGMCLFVILHEFSHVPAVIYEIFSSALDLRALGGGVSAFIISSGMREGFARGLLSNEAGAGTSSFSHTSHADDGSFDTFDGEYSKRAGVYGILEVIFDTLFLCPLTALVILLAGRDADFRGSISDICTVFERYLGRGAPVMLLFAVVAFAVSTTICWYYYGGVCFSYLTHGRYAFVFSSLFILSFAAGLIFRINALLYVNDIILFLLTLITLRALIKNRASLEKPE